MYDPYVYANLYPKIYCSTERRGFDLKSTSHVAFKAYKGKKDQTLGKDTKNYQIDYSVTKTFEQKPIKIDHFNDEEEKEVKGRVEKRKLKRRE